MSTSVIRQKGELQNGYYKKTKYPNILKSERLACFVFLYYPFWGSPFCLIPEDKSFQKNPTKNKAKETP